jgi:hypothetical protein
MLKLVARTQGETYIRGYIVDSGSSTVNKEEEYRQHAEDCRRLASLMRAGAHRDQLLQIAATWDKLAAERSATVAGLHETTPSVAKALSEAARAGSQ